jgi:hypothetical protein
MYRLMILTMAVGLVLGSARYTWTQPLPTPAAPAQSPPSVSGTVQQYLLTPHGEVDGLLLSDGTVVKFPPHLGAALASNVKPGDTVTAIGFLGPITPQGRAIKTLTITNTATGQTVVDQPPPSRPLPPDQRGLTRVPLTVSGTVAHVLVNDHGDVDDLILSTGEQVKFRPHNGTAVVMLLGQQPGATVQASGYGTRNAFGTVVDADTLMVGNQTIALR